MIATKAHGASAPGVEQVSGVLVGAAEKPQKTRPAAAGDALPVMRGVAGIAGMLLVTLSVLNLGMLWWSPQFGTAPWEFAVVGQTFDQLPLLVMGLLVLTYPAVTSGRAIRLSLAGVIGMLALAAAALSVLYGLAATVAWGTLVQQPSAGAGLLLRSIVKTLMLGAAYTLAFAWWMVLLLRRPGGRRGYGN